MTPHPFLSLGQVAAFVSLLSLASPAYTLPQRSSLHRHALSTQHQQRREKAETLANYIAEKRANPLARYRCQPEEPPYEACLAQFLLPPQRYVVMLTWERDDQNQHVQQEQQPAPQSFQGLGIFSFDRFHFPNLLFPKPANLLGIFDFSGGNLKRTNAGKASTDKPARFDQALERIIGSYW
ncbi:MAG: hypothetical protein AABX13_03670 [Nanoarchaeota archaeon]